MISGFMICDSKLKSVAFHCPHTLVPICCPIWYDRMIHTKVPIIIVVDYGINPNALALFSASVRRWASSFTSRLDT